MKWVGVVSNSEVSGWVVGHLEENGWVVGVFRGRVGGLWAHSEVERVGLVAYSQVTG